jgi:hypothetical protein
MVTRTGIWASVTQWKENKMTWRELNHQLGKTRDRKLVLKFYEAERKGSRRKRWLSRMYHRYSYLRRKKEMKAVASGESFV